MRAIIDSLGRFAAGFSPRRFPYRRFLPALVLGLIGGWLFMRARLPLPWMLGPMVACLLAALLRAPVEAPGVVRPPMTMVLGVLLGSAFRPDLFAQALDWLPTLLGLIGFMLACGLSCVTYFRRVAGLDPTTAFFAGMPGGLMEMVVLGEEKGGDARTIALIHAARVLLVVMTLPFIVQGLEGVALGARPPGGPSVLDSPPMAWLWLVGCGIVGLLVGRWLRLPAAVLLGPMLVSSLVHILGFSDFAPPYEIVNAAQLVLGITVGCRFVRTPPTLILRILALSLGSTAILLALTLAFAVLVSQLSRFGMVPLTLAYSPGGLAEMSLIALALNTEVAFVAAHHIIRIFLVMILAGPAFGLIARLRRPPAAVKPAE